VDLLDMGGMGLGNPPGGGNVLQNDVFGAAAVPAPPIRMAKVCPAEKSGGVEVQAGFHQVNSTVTMELEFINVSSDIPVNNLAIQLNKNAFSLSPANQQIMCNPPIGVGSSGRNSVELVVAPAMLAPVVAGQPATPQVQVAIKNMATGHVFYFALNFNLEAMFAADGTMERTAFIETWKNIDDQKELYSTVADLPSTSTDIDKVQAKFRAYNIFFVARRAVPSAPGQEVAYFSMKTMTGMAFLAELTFKQGINACKICVKTEATSYGSLAKVAVENVLRL